MTDNYPKYFGQHSGEALEIDLENETTVTFLYEFPHVLHVFMRRVMIKNGLKQVHAATSTASTGTNKYPNDPYYANFAWEYFGDDRTLIVRAGYNMYAVTKVCEEKIFATIASEGMYTSLYRQAEAQHKAKLETARLEIAVVSDVTYDPGLQMILDNTGVSDFSILCDDDETIPVHVTVLSTFWPFFNAMMSKDCIEKTEKTLKLDFPSNWIKKLVAYLYQQPIQLTLDEATGLLVISHMYDLPQLGEEAGKQIKNLDTRDTELEDLVSGWERSTQAENNTMRLFFVEKIAKHESTKEELKNWDDVKFLELYLDTVKLV